VVTTVSVLTIDLNELEEGGTTFTWNSSAEDLDLSDAEVEFSGPIRTVATLHRLADTLSAQGQTTYTIGVSCARCDEPIELSCYTTFHFVFQKDKPKGVEGDEDETLVWLDVDADELDLGKEVRDYVLLEIPMNPVCKEYESGTCPNLVDVEKAESEASDRGKADPRWDALKALKNT
tara:strand:+ start:1304 stop:1834 length:531 start_codon:yes stop_codon:yes gene_type:complete